VTSAEADVLVIPQGSRHPEEAFEFIRYVNSQKAMEKLCLGQKKFSPLAEVSEEFWQQHPHPYIRLFQSLGRSANAYAVPKTGIWNEYARELTNGVDLIQNLTLAPAKALGEVERRMQTALDRERSLAARRPEIAPVRETRARRVAP